MRKLVLGAMTLAFANLASPLVNPASAATYPFCAFGTGTCAEACDFASLQQCRAFLIGDQGYCGANPRYTSGANALNFTPRSRR